jgi:hypothetical protein
MITILVRMVSEGTRGASCHCGPGDAKMGARREMGGQIHTFSKCLLSSCSVPGLC